MVESIKSEKIQTPSQRLMYYLGIAIENKFKYGHSRNYLEVCFVYIHHHPDLETDMDIMEHLQ